MSPQARSATLVHAMTSFLVWTTSIFSLFTDWTLIENAVDTTDWTTTLQQCRLPFKDPAADILPPAEAGAVNIVDSRTSGWAWMPFLDPAELLRPENHKYVKVPVIEVLFPTAKCPNKPDDSYSSPFMKSLSLV